MDTTFPSDGIPKTNALQQMEQMTGTQTVATEQQRMSNQRNYILI
jgi:hypothetical protein